jgi:hypothetical protein
MKNKDQSNEKDSIQTLRDRGLTCSKLKSLENKQREDAKTFRKVGFENIANVEEQTADKISDLRKKVCLLK